MYEVKPNQSVELLKELHILTRDGKMAAIRLLWERLGDHAWEARRLMENEDHDERSPVHTN